MDIISLFDVDNSKVLWGCASIVTSLGSRFLVGELTPMQQAVMRHPLAKRLVLVCMFFAATRDLLLSISLAFVASVLLEYLFNEQSDLCLLRVAPTPVVGLAKPHLRPHPRGDAEPHPAAPVGSASGTHAD